MLFIKNTFIYMIYHREKYVKIRRVKNYAVMPW